MPSSTRTTASPIYTKADCVSLDKLGFWREVYNRAEHLIRNWRSGVYVIAPILKGHKGKISAFDSDGLDFLKIGLSTFAFLAGKLKVFSPGR